MPVKASDLIRDVTLRVKTTGADQAIAQTTALGKSTDGLAVASDKLSKTQLSVEKALERVKNQVDATYRQQRLFEAGQRTLDRAMQQGSLSLSDYERNLSLLGAKYAPVAAANDNAARSFGSLATAGKTALSELSPIAGAAGSIVSALGPVGIAIGVVAAASQLIANAGDVWTRYGNQLVAAGVASSALAATQKDIAELAIATRSSLEATVGLYARMTRASSELGTSQADVRRVTEILGKELANSGLSAAEAAGGLLQFSQGLQAGRFQGDELRSVLENLPGVARAIAKEFNTTVGGLRELGAAGELTSERVFKAVLSAGKGIDEAFGKSIPTATQAMEQLATASTRLFAEIDKRLGISKNRAQAIAELATVASAIASKLDTPGDGGRAAQTTAEYERALKGLQDQIRAFDQRGMAQDAANARAEFERLSSEFRNVQNAADAAAMGARNAAAGFGDAGQQANVASSAVISFGNALRSIQMGIPDVAKVLTAQKNLAELSATSAQAAEKSSLALRAESLDRNDAALAAQRHALRMKELNETVTERQRVITGATDLEKSFNDALKKTTIDGLDGEAKAVARARDEYEQRTKQIADAQKLGMSDAEVTMRRAQAEKILALEIKNATSAAKSKASSGGGSSSSSDAFDNALQRTRDQIEELKLQQDAASKATFEIYKLTEAHRLRRAAMSAGRAEEAGVTEQINEAAEALARQRVATEASIEANRRLKDSFDFAADGFKSFAEDLITGSDGIQGALKNLGKGFLSASLDALISGKGPLAGLSGLAPSAKGEQGGLLGIMIAGLPKAVERGAEKGAKTGSVDGVVTGIDIASSSGNGANLLGIDGKNLAAGLTAISGLAGAYGVGLSAGSSTQAALGGALSGGMAGLSLAGSSIGASLGGAGVLGPVGLAIGAGLAIMGQQEKKKAEKAARKAEAEAAYQNATSSIATFRSEARGEPQDTLAKRIAEAEASAKKLSDIAYLSGRAAEANEIFADGQVYVARALSEYRDGFMGLLDAMNTGLGPNSPFSSAKDAIKQFGVELQSFVKNTATAYGEASTEVRAAQEAAAAYALTVLNGSRNLTTVETRFQEIMGTAAGLTKVLTDLGWASQDAAEAVKNGTTAALARLKDAFENDLQAKTNDALDKGYLNDARNLLNEIGTLARDAQAIGTNPDAITRYFQAAAQNLVNEANLTGDAFNEFLSLFPEFTGNVVAAGQALEDASRRLGYIDRLFNATNDSSTLAGQLAAYDRQAMRERGEEIKLGGQYILELEAAQQAERFNIIRDFNKAANDNYKQSLQQAQDYVARFTRSIQEYLDGLRSGADSPLSPGARLAAATSQFNTQYGLAQGGNRDALDSIASYADALLEAQKAMNSSSPAYQAAFQDVIDKLGALPGQISAEQFIVNAIEAGADQTTTAIDAMKITLQSAVSSGSASEIAAALSTYFSQLDTNTSGLIDFAEMQQALGGMASNSALRDMFTRIDTDNSGSISRLEAINSSTGLVRSSSERQEQSLQTANQLSQQIASLTSAVSSSTSATNQNVATGNGVLYGINNQTNVVAYYSDLIVRNLRSQGYNWGAQSVNGYTIPVFRDGGLIGGTGTGTSDSNMIMASRGEFVMRAAAVDKFGVGMLSQMNDNLRAPVMPVAVGGGQSNAALVSELRAMRKELADLKSEMARNTQVAAKGHERTAAAVDEQTVAVKADTRKNRSAGVAGRGAKIAA